MRTAILLLLVVASPSLAADEKPLSLVCTTTSGQVCNEEDGCEDEAAKWKFVFERTDSGLRRRWVTNMKKGETTRDQTEYEVVVVQPGGSTVLVGNAGLASDDTIILTQGRGGFVSFKSSAGFRTTRVGSCVSEIRP